MKAWMVVVAFAFGCRPEAAPDEADDTDVAAAGPCAALGLTAVPFQSEGSGAQRWDLAPDFTVPDQNGDWTLSSAWTGCDTYVFISDGYTTTDGQPLWAEGDVDKLLKRSAPNVHYFFVSQQSGKSAVDERVTLITGEVEAALAKLDPGDAPGQAGWWTGRVHIVQKGSGALGFVGKQVEEMGGGGSLGFAIDRTQHLRGIGSLADNRRYDASQEWPFLDNLSFYAYESIFYNWEVERDARLTALQNPVTVTLWEDEVLAQYADTTVELPSAEQMATFDTFLIELSALCPDLTVGEAVNNCGAWDYIGNVYVQEAGTGAWLELSRFITPYHREQGYVLDASALLPLIAQGGSRTFRYSFAPEWNTQPTLTTMTFWFADQGTGQRPREVYPLFTGGAFGPDYNGARPPITLPLSADASKVAVWSLITGHGSSAGDQCAEFCDHQHEVTVGGHSELLAFPEVDDDQGCLAKVDQGVVPNQWGTWWFGRGGWCPGQAVDPWQVDVTAWATPGQDVTVGYRGLFRGEPPTVSSGDISMTSWLVVYQ
jgi:hypothetical protein